MTEQTSLQPACEIEAIAYFDQVGRAKVEEQLATLDKAIAARYEGASAWPLSGHMIFDIMTAEERALRHKLALGLMLCIDERAEAQKRLFQRISLRKARQAVRVGKISA